MRRRCPRRRYQKPGSACSPAPQSTRSCRTTQSCRSAVCPKPSPGPAHLRTCTRMLSMTDCMKCSLPRSARVILMSCTDALRCHSWPRCTVTYRRPDAPLCWLDPGLRATRPPSGHPAWGRGASRAAGSRRGTAAAATGDPAWRPRWRPWPSTSRRAPPDDASLLWRPPTRPTLPYTMHNTVCDVTRCIEMALANQQSHCGKVICGLRLADLPM